MALELMPATASPWSWYAVTVLVIGFPYVHSINGQYWYLPTMSGILWHGSSYSQLDLAERWFCTNAHCRKCSIQYDLPSRCYHFIQRAFSDTLKCLFSCGWLGLWLTYLLFQIYRTDDKPYYRKGNKILLAIVAWNVVVTIFIKVYYTRRNKTREQAWNAMSPEQKHHYLSTTKDEGNKRLDFRFAH